jgi:alpha-tubulin suppressor-like RCC1 family protein
MKLRPTLMQNLDNIVSVMAGDGVSFVLDAQGQVFGFGKNTYSQLGVGGRGSKMHHNPVLVKTLDFGAIEAMALGGFHSLFLTVRGFVLGVGENSGGQLGLGDNKKRYTPTLIADIGL